MRTRYVTLDCLRIVCAFAIIIIHVTSAALTYSAAPSAAATVAMHLSTILMAWAVPCFFMLTGFLMLGDDKPCTYGTIKKSLLKFFVALFLIGGFYALLEIVFNTRSVSLSTFSQAFCNILTGKLWDHMWYVYAVIGVYLLLPLIKPFLSQSKLQGDLVLFSISCFYTIVLPYISNFFNYQIPIKFSLSGWIFYVILGGLVGKYKQYFLARKKVVFVVSLSILVCSTIAIVIKYTQKQSFGIVSYTSLSVFLTASAALLLSVIAKSPKPKYEGLLSQISACCWGIYLIHPLFINLLIKAFKFNPIDFVWWITIPLSCCALFVLCAFIIWILRKIPLLRKFLF